MTLFNASLSKHSLVLATLVALGACSTKNNDPTPTPATTTGVTWTADNANYSSTVANVAVQGADMVVTGIAASSSSGNNTISLLVPAATGTYSIAGATGNANYSMSYNVNSSSTSATVYVASNLRGNGSGTVTVSTFSATEVAGTFTFTGDNASGGADTKIITSGKFNVKR